MAKSGDITAAGASEPIKSAILGDITPEMTLGQVAAASLSGSSAKLQVEVDPQTRVVRVNTPDPDDAADPSGDAVAVFEPDTDGKTTSWTGTGLATLIPVVNAQSKRSLSLASLVSALEDKLLELGLTHKIFVDQVTEKVSVIPTDVSGISPADADATFTQTLPATDNTIKNAFE